MRACLPQLDGLNDAARAFLEAKLAPERLHPELAAMDTFVYEDAGVVHGLAALDGMVARRLYVDPAAQGRGIARALFERVEALARSKGLQQITGEASPAAAAFYEKLGFRAEGRSEVYRGEARFTMIRVFKPLG